jgi:asparagine synthase (glutamine-hydrolysing)
VVGDLFASPAGGRSPFAGLGPGGGDPTKVAGQLVDAHWGRYVALLGAPSGVSALRDPSGLLPCLLWPMGDGVQVVSSDVLRAPAELRPRRLALNWDRIGAFAGLITADPGEPLFDGVRAVGPGELQSLTVADQAPTLIWRPAAYAAPSQADLVEARQEIVCRVDACTADLAGGYHRTLVELSGGLDSSIVAGSLAAVGLGDRVAGWLNRVGDRGEGNESAYAQAVTDRLGVPLTVIAKPLTSLTPEDFAELGGAFWPATLGTDVSRDRDEVVRLHDAGAEAMITGDGGDAVFFQMPSALVFDDSLRRDGLSALTGPLFANVARRSRQSVWGVAREVAAARRNPGRPVMTPSPYVGAEHFNRLAGLRHRWEQDAIDGGVSMAKRLQIVAVANCQVFHGGSRRSRVADTVFPLLAQPVVEFCLSLNAADLAGESYDRPFARTAFAHRLPEVVVQRRTKGNLTGYFSRLVAGSLDTLRPWLLDGCLCDAGVFDRAKLDAALDPRQLIWGVRITDLLAAAALEAWVRHWQGRLPDSHLAPRRRPALDA